MCFSEFSRSDLLKRSLYVWVSLVLPKVYADLFHLLLLLWCVLFRDLDGIKPFLKLDSVVL